MSAPGARSPIGNAPGDTCRLAFGRAGNLVLMATQHHAAKVPRFERPFCNMRASRVTELRLRFDPKVVAVWLGHSESISTKHYTQVRPEDFAAAVAPPVAPQVAPKAAEMGGTDPKPKKANPEKTSDFPGSAVSFASLRVVEVLRQGFEP